MAGSRVLSRVRSDLEINMLQSLPGGGMLSAGMFGFGCLFTKCGIGGSL
jgi:hypothetical protein